MRERAEQSTCPLNCVTNKQLSFGILLLGLEDRSVFFLYATFSTRTRASIASTFLALFGLGVFNHFQPSIGTFSNTEKVKGPPGGAPQQVSGHPVDDEFLH